MEQNSEQIWNKIWSEIRSAYLGGAVYLVHRALNHRVVSRFIFENATDARTNKGRNARTNERTESATSRARLPWLKSGEVTSATLVLGGGMKENVGIHSAISLLLGMDLQKTWVLQTSKISILVWEGCLSNPQLLSGMK